MSSLWQRIILDSLPALPGCHGHQQRCPPQSTSQTSLWDSAGQREISSKTHKSSPCWIANKHVFSSASQWAHYSIFLVTGWLYNAWSSCERRMGFLPRSSSPAVSLEGATLMHRLVNLRIKKDTRFTIWIRQAPFASVAQDDETFVCLLLIPLLPKRDMMHVKGFKACTGTGK